MDTSAVEPSPPTYKQAVEIQAAKRSAEQAAAKRSAKLLVYKAAETLLEKLMKPNSDFLSEKSAFDSATREAKKVGYDVNQDEKIKDILKNITQKISSGATVRAAVSQSPVGLFSAQTTGGRTKAQLNHGQKRRQSEETARLLETVRVPASPLSSKQQKPASQDENERQEPATRKKLGPI